MAQSMLFAQILDCQDKHLFVKQNADYVKCKRDTIEAENPSCVVYFVAFSTLSYCE